MSWSKETRRQALAMASYCCTICCRGFRYKEGYLVLHHILSRNKGEHTLGNAEVRCKSCERIAHQISRDGNLSPRQRRAVAYATTYPSRVHSLATNPSSPKVQPRGQTLRYR